MIRIKETLTSCWSPRFGSHGFCSFENIAGLSLSATPSGPVSCSILIARTVPFQLRECSETAEGVARESKGVKSCPRAGCGKSARPVRWQQRAGQTAPDAAFGTFSLRALLCSGLRRSEQRPDLPNLCSHGPAHRPDPMLEIAVAVALRTARPSCPTMHSSGT